MMVSNHRRKLFIRRKVTKKKKKACHGYESIKEKEMRVDERET